MAQRWSSDSAASAFAHGIFYFLIRGGGRRVAYALLLCVATWYTLFNAHGQRGEFYLARRFNDSGWLKKLWRRWRLNFSFGQVLIDRAAAGISGSAGVAGEREFTAQITALLARGRGALIVSAHLGCWQMAMAAMEIIPVPKYVVYRRPDGDVDKLAHEHGGLASTVQFIDPAGPFGGTPEIMAALARNAVVCVTGDRVFGSARGALSVPFLGGNINVPASAYRIAAATGAPLLVIFFPRLGAGRVGAELTAVMDIPDRGANVQNYRAEAERFAAAMEKFCAARPYQFFNFFDLWE
ncbi:MAG: lysophospholipid acyltransferase family protein [Verrucomicrobiales bacterium]|jgi:predicted LPLAT superfamily acyltransferase|nr:lysophospholipid acyltransferase family protein [Verrucomicrobiales bacterium]